MLPASPRGPRCTRAAWGAMNLLLPLGVVLLNVYALVLVLLRAAVFRVPVYRPMLLNIGLSVAPAAVVLVTAASAFGVVTLAPNQFLMFAVLAVGGVVWVLLLPNAGYLITELNFSHRHVDDPVPLWYDIVAVLTLALSGVVNTLVNVLVVQVGYVLIVRPNDDAPLAHADSWLLALATLLLVTLGIYLGRYVRFNSWDLLHPRSFAGKLFSHFRERRNLATAGAFCLLHTAFLAIFYLIVVGPVAALLENVSAGAV